MHKINNEITIKVLGRLHAESSSEKLTIMKGVLKGIFRGLRPKDMKDAYIAITEKQGQYIYDLLISLKSKNIVEFGTSFGVSTIYLGAAAKENNGQVITTELLPSKSKIASQNFKEAKVESYIELITGDVMETLKDAPNGIDFLLLDGWNDLYLPLLKMLEPKLADGAHIYIDNIDFSGSKPFAEYIDSHPDKYTSKRLSFNKGGATIAEFRIQQ